MNRFRITSLVLLLSSPILRPDTLVIPANLPNGGGGYIDIPPGATGRYQELFPASFFGAQSGPMEITQFAWREGTDGTINSDTVIPALEIKFSTTATTASSLSRMLDLNVGHDQATVFPSSSYLLKASRNPTGNGPFDIKFQLPHPFTYNPARGNLLIDLLITSDAGGLSFGSFNDSGQLAWARAGAFSTFGSGPTTEFTFSRLPPTLYLNLSNNAVVLSWTDSSYSLQAAPIITSIFTNVPNAASPFRAAIAGSQMFFRLHSN